MTRPRSRGSDASLRRELEAHDWQRFAGTDAAICVWIEHQRVDLVQRGAVLGTWRCSTAAAGAGERADSLCTPRGWHEIVERVGESLPLGAVLRSRVWTGEIWRGGTPPDEDLILTRILRLGGLEPGRNQGGDVDSMRRHIYIHGTSDEGHLGTPSSHGCVRLANADVIDLFGRTHAGMRVVIVGAPS